MIHKLSAICGVTIVVNSLLLVEVASAAKPDEKPFVPLFAEEGVPKGWVVRQWDDVRKKSDAPWSFARASSAFISPFGNTCSRNVAG